MNRLLCVPLGFTVRIERSPPEAPGSPGGPPPGTPSGGLPRDLVLHIVSLERAEGTARAEPGPSDGSAANLVPLLAGESAVAAEATASALGSSNAGMSPPNPSEEPPARRRRYN